jgi:hypothetical protein
MPNGFPDCPVTAGFILEATAQVDSAEMTFGARARRQIKAGKSKMQGPQSTHPAMSMNPSLLPMASSY